MLRLIISGGFAIIKVGDTESMVFKPNYVGPYKMPRNEREEPCNGDVKGEKCVNKTNSDVMQKLWTKLLQTFPGQINGKFMMLGKWMYFDKNKQPPKIKDNKNISSSKAIKFCEKYNFGLSEQQLKQKLMKELVLMTT